MLGFVRLTFLESGKMHAAIRVVAADDGIKIFPVKLVDGVIRRIFGCQEVQQSCAFLRRWRPFEEKIEKKCSYGHGWPFPRVLPPTST